MDPKTKALFEARANVVKAMAHPSRLYIVDRLSERKHCVCELTGMIGADISTVSKHLAILRNAGIIASERVGTEIHYSLRAPCVLNFFSCIEGVLKKDYEERMRILA